MDLPPRRRRRYPDLDPETLALLEAQRRPPGRPRKKYPDLDQEALASLEVQQQPVGRRKKYPDLDQETLASLEVQQQPVGRPRKRPREHEEHELRSRVYTGEESVVETGEQPVTTGLDESRKGLVDARIRFEDDRWFQRLRDSDQQAWCKSVTRELQLETVESFYKAMHDESTLEIRHCVLCGLQTAPKDLINYTWEAFLPLYTQMVPFLRPSELDYFECRLCFPRDNTDIPICSVCTDALQKERLPRACQVNMLQLKCQHRYPQELADLSPLEERLIGIFQPYGWITKFQIDLDKGTSGRYRKLKKGHVTVFPNDVQGLCSNVLPHPLVAELDRIHVCFVPPHKPAPKDVEFVLAVDPQKLKRALVWLKTNNPLYNNIRISDDYLHSWKDSCHNTLVPQVLFDSMVTYDHTTEDIIRTAHYVPSMERGGIDQPILTAGEVIEQLEHRENDAVQMELESGARFGGVYSRDLEENDMNSEQIEQEVSELVSTGLIGTEIGGEYSIQERLRQLRNMMGNTDSQHDGYEADVDTGNSLITHDERPFIANRHGEQFADSNDPDFFPKSFPSLFPWGVGGPKNIILTADTSDEPRSRNANFSLRLWARYLLRRHGGRFAVHPSFPFLAFNMLVRSENRRVSNIRIAKRSFQKVRQIHESLTSDEIRKAEEEYRETRTTTNPRIAYLLRELSAFGHGQHMSNEERLYNRRKIQSLILQFGILSVWFTINPNDLTNEINMKLTAFRGQSGREAEELFHMLQQHINSIQYTVRDPVSAATFFHREISLFFDKYVRTGEDSIFGKVSCYFGCVETNERGALHLHGFLWLDANVHLPTLLNDVVKPESETYREQVCKYIDSVFSESCDEQAAKLYRRWESVFKYRPELIEDRDRLNDIFDQEANWVAYRCNLHSCGPTCVKYSFKNRHTGTNFCRFKAPWKLYNKTEFTSDGLFHVARDHSRVNRYNKALSIGLRHNTDVTFLPTNSAALAMVFYGTNYATKLDAPLWKRAALMGAVFDKLSMEKHSDTTEFDGEQQRLKNDKTRQFLARTANQIFTSRELSSVEVCANLLGNPNSYSSQKTWQNIHMKTLYWAVFRRWKAVQDAAGPQMQLHETPETVNLNEYGVRLTVYEAYAHRGPLLKGICFYEYLCIVNFHRIGRKADIHSSKYFPFDESLEAYTGTWIQELRENNARAIPTITGHLVDKLEASDLEPELYHWTAITLLALFVPWEQFMAIDKLQGFKFSDPDLPTVDMIWLECLEHLPGRIKAIYSNVQLLRKCAEDAKKDARLWAERSEGDEGKEFDEPEEGFAAGSVWQPDEIQMRFSLHEFLADKQYDGSTIHTSQSLRSLVDRLQKAGFSESMVELDEDQDHQIYYQTQLNLPKPTLNMIKAAQGRLDKERILAIEGDDGDTEMQRSLNQTENNFDNDGQGEQLPLAAFHQPEEARTWVDIASNQSFFQIGQDVAKKMTLNRLQWTALGLICEAMDRLDSGDNNENENPAAASTNSTNQQKSHFQYIGGSGGTGKSWVIKAIQSVFAIKGVRNEMLITATSGTAAAGICGNTIHSAVGLTFKDRDGQQQENRLDVSDEKRKQRWRRRKLLIIDEVSMLGLDTLYEIDQKLKYLRGFPDRDFGGLPIVIFSGDFLQFGPIQQKGLLSNIEQVTENDVTNKPNDKRVQRLWRQLMAKRLWQKFDNIIILEEQKRAKGDPFLLELLERIRQGQQTQGDMDRLNNTCYDPQTAMDFSHGRRAITPLNRHRWDLTLHAVLEFGKEKNRKVSIFLSAHQWKSRIPSEDEMEAIMQLGDAGPLSIPSIFAYVEGMPVIVNQNKYLGLKVANGSEFTAVGIIPDPNIKEHVVDESLSIFFGPPAGILLHSEDLKGLRIPHLPPDTLMLVPELIPLQKQKHGRYICPHLYQKPGFELGVSRRGLPCVPGFVLTDYKSQSRTMEKVLLGLYGRRGGDSQDVDKCDIISLYVQLSRCRELATNTRLLQPLRPKDFLESRMSKDLISGIEDLKKAAIRTTEAFAARTDNIC